MLIVKTKLKLFGAYGLVITLALFLVCFSFYLLYHLLFDFKELVDEPWPILIIFVPFTASFLILETIRNGRNIKVQKSGLYIYEFLNTRSFKIYSWSDFEYWITVEEQSNSGNHESIWIVKKDKSFIRISSFYLKNYTEIKGIVSINLDYSGNKRFNQFKLLWYVLRSKL